MVSRQQLPAAGYRRGQISGLVSGGRLETLPRWIGVYRAAGTPSTPEATQWAAVLDARCVLSYLSAAAWWELPVPDDCRVHVTAPNRRRTKAPAGVRVHRVGLEPSDITERFGMPITTRTETILDCAGWLPLGPASTLIDRALQQKWLTGHEIQWRLDEQPGRWGNRQLARLLRQSAMGAHAESERRMIRILRQAGIAGWTANHVIEVGGRTFVLDIAFAERRIAIEIDGWAFHSDVERFRSDRRRGNTLVAAGWTVLRFTWADLVEHPEGIVATLTRLLAA
ncbi:Transcriptional regulator, AbiEi antitoxin, Type IV TA system [Frankineae bacterium MT45]|nr:Transcriptional regulator, AbiEi antitoxin, Type IV TA system [Frankineae bacterium MT45]